MRQVYSYKPPRRKKTLSEKVACFFTQYKKKITFLFRKLKKRTTTKHNFTNPNKIYYPKENIKLSNNLRDSKKKFKKVLGLIFKISLISSILALIVLIIIFIQFSKELPEPGKINTRFIPESTKIYDKTGKVLLYEIHGEEKRTIIPADQIPNSIKQATIALEDRHFYEHHGIRPKSILRAVASQIFKIGTPSGGSTITQQLVKNSMLSNEHSISRKIKEAILAIEVEMKFSKEEILAMYLNEIPYGSNAYGVEAASETFFGKHAKDLTIDEAAILASLPQAPSRYSPYGSKRNLLKGRQEWAITQMANLGFISEQEAQNAKAVDVFKKIQKNKENIKAPHFVMYVKEKIEEMYGEKYLEDNGLTIITTLDWDKQQIAQKIVKEKAFENQKKYNAQNAALVAIIPESGEIITMVGSRDYFDEQIDGNVNVALSQRQPGSSFKPYVFLLSFIKGYTPETILFDVKTHFPIEDQSKDYVPQNYTGKFVGAIKIKKALAMSLNIPAVKALYLVGIPDTIEFVKKLGLTSLKDPKRYGLSLVLGGGEVKLLNHVGAFSIIANNGVENKKHAIAKIINKHGEIVFENKPIENPKQLVKEKYIGMLSHALSTNEYRVAAFGKNNALRFDNRQVAAKTGTTNENKDAWTIGYTPDVAIGVWGGNNDNRSMNSRGVGSNVAAPIFREFLLEAFPEPSQKKFPEYLKEKVKTNKDILDGKLEKNKKEEVCQISKKHNKYCYVNKYCPKNRIKKRTVIKAHSMLYYVKKDDPVGDEPENPEEDPAFDAWEKGVIDYYKGDEKTVFDYDLDECKKDDFSDYTSSIEFKDISVSNNNLHINVSIDSPFGVKEIIYKINGNVIDSTDSHDTTYALPDNLNNSSITVSATLIDNADNETTTEKTKQISF